MGSLIRRTTNCYHYVNEELADPRTKDYPFISNPFTIIALLVLYRQIVLKWGPAFMKDRQPLNLKYVIALYNIYQIYKCSFLTIDALSIYLSGYYSITCQAIIPGNGPMELFVADRYWQYYSLKLIDLLDTIFFVLRKKFNQITFLHIYHHMGMVILGYIATKYVPGGHGVMLGLINSFVHSVMYSYYLVALVKPLWVQQWWKKYITQLQILQFFIIITHFSRVLVDTNCEYPKWVSVALLPHNVFIIILFSNFYYKTYLQKKSNEMY